LSGIGSVLDDQGNFDEALRAFRESYNLYNKVKDAIGMLVELNNIGKAYSNKGMSDSAIFYYKLVIKRRLETNNEYGLANSYGNIASEYAALGNLGLALSYYNKSYEIHKRINALEGLGLICSGIAWTHYKQGHPLKALPYIKEGIGVGETVSNPEILMNLHNVAYTIYESLNDYRTAHEHFKKFKMYEDSLVNISTKEAALKGQMQYEYDKKELLMKNENEKFSLMQKQEISRQRWIIYSVAGGLVIVLLFSFFLYNRFKIIRRQKHIIEHQKEIVEEKQKEILDSIRYAKRIQQSLLPNDTYISKSLKEKSRI
jgi:tetratricopeptide (TPR) repeat protein